MAIPERARWTLLSVIYDMGLIVLWVVMYPSLGVALWGLYNYYEYVHPYTHACTPIYPTSNLFDVRNILIGVTIPSLLVGNRLCWIGRQIIARRVIPSRGHMCLKCHHDLSARPRDDDTCTECGLNAPRRECVRLWCKLLRSRF